MTKTNIYFFFIFYSLTTQNQIQVVEELEKVSSILQLRQFSLDLNQTEKQENNGISVLGVLTKLDGKKLEALSLDLR